MFKVSVKAAVQAHECEKQMETKASPSLAREVNYINLCPWPVSSGPQLCLVEPSLSPLGYDLNFTSMLCDIEGI